ncbi:MAG: hypothetical protein AAFO29_06665, partial [Actinomycetota bacterium]
TTVSTNGDAADTETESESDSSADAETDSGTSTSDSFDLAGASVVELIERADALLDEADEAERNGQDDVAIAFREQAREALVAAQQLLSG